MNEQTTKLIGQLAHKLGTTTEYLWNVLIKQAQISAMIDLVYFIVVSIMGVGLYKLHMFLSKEESYGDESWYERLAGLDVAMIILSIIWTIFFIVSFFSIGNIFNGFLNPEYWALKEVLKALK